MVEMTDCVCGLKEKGKNNEVQCGWLVVPLTTAEKSGLSPLRSAVTLGVLRCGLDAQTLCRAVGPECRCGHRYWECGRRVQRIPPHSEIAVIKATLEATFAKQTHRPQTCGPWTRGPRQYSRSALP